MSVQHPNPHLSPTQRLSGGQIKSSFLLLWFFKKSKNVAGYTLFIYYKGQREHVNLQ